jgi:hypothetical protein
VLLVIWWIPRDLARVSVENVLGSELDDNAKVTIVQPQERFGHDTFKNSTIAP